MAGKKPRVLNKTCSGVVLNRIMKELNIKDPDIVNGTEGKIPYSTLFDWRTGKIPSSPDQLDILISFLKKFKPDFSMEYFYFGEDGDRAELKRKLKESEDKRKKLERENAVLNYQISIFEEIRIRKKLGKKEGNDEVK